LRQIHLSSKTADHIEADGNLSNLPSFDDILNKAFLLACFIQGDRQTAISIVAQAMIKLEVAAASQGKRLYYKPIGRNWPRRSKSEGFRNKVSFNELHLLQRLVYIESEPYEIEKERTNTAVPSEQDLVIHFIKHLVRITIKRNSFYVTLGLSRLLYYYSTAETMEIYNAVIQDPDRVKDDYYYRSRKGVLMQEMKEQFGDLLKICRGAHGEERFQTHESPAPFIETVEQCLSAFTPWWTACLISGSDPVADGIPQFSYQGHQKEDKIEVNRIHAVLHPLCLSRLIKGLGFQAPDQNLAIPSFFLSNSGSSDGGSGVVRHPAELNEDELQSLKRDLDEQSERRRSASANLLRIIVDGVERGHLDLNRGSSFDFDLQRGAELIEVRGVDRLGNEFLLATHLMAHAEEAEAKTLNASIVLERGQKISFNISPTNEVANSKVSLKYSDTNPLRAAPSYFRQRVNALNDGGWARIWSRYPLLATTLGCILLAIAIVTAIQYAKRETVSKVSNTSPDTQLAGPSAEGPNNSSPPVAQNNLNPARPDTAKIEGRERSRVTTTVGDAKEKGNVAANPVQPNKESAIPADKSGSEGELTRSLGTGSAAVSLSNVKKIYVTLLGNLRANESLRDRLIENLRASNSLSFAPSRDEADALMKVVMQKSLDMQPEMVSISVQLINARGEIIWPTSHTRSGGTYQGSIATVSRNIIEDLLREKNGN
jgi:hypothetical protein